MAAITDLLTQATNGTRPSPTTLTAIHTNGQTTLTVNSLTGWPTATAVHFIVYNINASGAKIAGSQTDWKGISNGTTSITGLVLKAGTDNGYSTGAVVECAPTAAWADDVVSWGTAAHNQDGSHATGVIGTTAVAANAITAAKLSTALQQGWEDTFGTTAFPTPNTVTYNGNRNYSLVFNSVDLTGAISNGMRLKLTRTATAPTQCTSLNGTTQFYSKTSPAGMTFTNNFVVSAWVKLSSYNGATMAIASRFNGTSGFYFALQNTGQVVLVGFNGSGSNFSQVQSYQSIPLNKWVHVAAQLDMATFTATTTTSYVMIDGVDVASAVSRGGTNPTALVQAGNLEVGSYNAGTNPFPGKIAQVAIYSAKVTEATITASIPQSLVGTETSLVSAYSFNNNINDLNANANNLTANGSAVATNADSPFAGGANASTAYTAGTTEFGEVFNISFSTNTTLVVQVPDGYAIPTSGGVSAVSYSTQASPLGWQGPIVQIGYMQINSTITAPLSNLGITVYVPPGRRLKLTAVFSDNRDSGANGGTSLSILEGGTALIRSIFFPVAASSEHAHTPSVVLPPTTGSHTYTLTFAEVGGVGTATFTGGVTNYSYFAADLV